MLIKVCGMRDAENIVAIESLGVDMLGFIFYDRSPRYIGGQVLPNTKCSRVGVFVDETFDQMIKVAQRDNLTHIQLHGDEAAEICRQLRAEGYKVIKAISVASSEDVAKTTAYEVDYFLFDTKCSNYGGSGRQFDWSALESYKGNTPFLLSGGINPDSAADILNFNHPRFAGLDLNSGFEDAPAVKNIQKLNQFLKQIR